MRKRVKNSGDVNQKSSRNKRNKSGNSPNRRLTAARKHPKPDLDHIHHRQQQKQAAHNGSHSGSEHPQSENPLVDVNPKRLIHVLAVDQVDCELEALRDEGREEEEA